MKIILKLLKPIYLFAVCVDILVHKLFSFMVYKAHRKVISIGNLTTGGTGKTPVLFELTKELSDKNPCVITRGYKSPYEYSFFHLQGKGPHSRELTDEALLFNLKFPNVPLLLGKRRDRSVRYAVKNLDPGLFILDDGFQFRKLHKDIEIILWDSLTASEEAELLPAGILREPASRLADADVILLTRCESADQKQIAHWEKWLHKHSNNKPVIKMKTVTTGLFSKDHNKIQPRNFPKNCAVFCAIGNPDSFMEQLRQIGIKPVEIHEFRDHHKFDKNDIEKLLQTTGKSNLPLICTEKDMIKVPANSHLDFYYLSIRMIPCSGISLLQELARIGMYF